MITEAMRTELDQAVAGPIESRFYALLDSLQSDEIIPQINALADLRRALTVNLGYPEHSPLCGIAMDYLIDKARHVADTEKFARPTHKSLLDPEVPHGPRA